MITGRINQVSFYFFPKFKFADGPAVDKFFTREMVKFGNPCSKSNDLAILPLLVDKTAIRPLAWPTALISLIKRPLRLAGLNKTAMFFLERSI